MGEHKYIVANQFAYRHIGPRHDNIAHMLATIGKSSLSDLISSVIARNVFENPAIDCHPQTLGRW